MAHMNASRPVLDNFAKQVEDIAFLEKPAKIEGRNMSIVLGQKRK